MRRTYLLAFDPGRGTGVREHFFHFMWGYLLPAASAILDLRSAPGPDPRRVAFVFTSCGPVMDAKTAEMASLLGAEFTIVQDEREAARPDVIRVVVPRWDSFLCDSAQYARQPWGAGMIRLARQVAQRRSIPPILWSRPALVRKILQVRAVILEQVQVREGGGRHEGEARCYHILKRSMEPSYYAPDGGGATEPTYGTSRRSLLGIEQAAVALTRDSCLVRVFEPGAHSLAEQVRTFNRSKGIIAVRGAELANIVWLDPASRVIVINAGTFLLSAPPAWALARLLGLSYVEIDWGDDPYPALTDELTDRVRGYLED